MTLLSDLDVRVCFLETGLKRHILEAKAPKIELGHVLRPYIKLLNCCRRYNHYDSFWTGSTLVNGSHNQFRTRMTLNHETHYEFRIYTASVI